MTTILGESMLNRICEGEAGSGDVRGIKVPGYRHLKDSDIVLVLLAFPRDNNHKNLNLGSQEATPPVTTSGGLCFSTAGQT